jgi:NadR type nicotinamide-nucleotide adenylyltransferase
MIRIAITGPESSGKTTLAKELAKQLNAQFIPEFAREYLQESSGKYEISDLDEIARGHLNQITKSQNSIQIVDSDFIVLKVWSDYRFGKSSSLIDQLVSKNIFEFYFLCSPDIPWEEDSLRENPNDRDLLFEQYLIQLNERKLPFEIISGTEEERIEKCIAILTERFKLIV